MKVTLRYEEDDERELNMTLRLTLPNKYATGPTKDVVKLFVEYYNKKHTENPLEAETLHLKVAGGNHLDRAARMEDFVASGDELYVLGGEVLGGPAPPAKRAATVSGSAPSSSPATSSKPAGDDTKAEKGKVRCKRFGCNKFFDPEGPPQECVHHKSPPIFHETAKWWSCCQDRKAYDWEEFMRIPGCQKSTCSSSPDGQEGKRFLGGCDLRGDNAPIRLDVDAPRDPRHRLDDLRRGLVAIGVDGALFEKVWAKLAAEAGGDMDRVCRHLQAHMSAVLSAADA